MRARAAWALRLSTVYEPIKVAISMTLSAETRLRRSVSFGVRRDIPYLPGAVRGADCAFRLVENLGMMRSFRTLRREGAVPVHKNR